MTAWKGVLDEDARWDVINYVQALGSGAVTPMENMGSAPFDSEIELAQRAEMLADAVAQDVIAQAEAGTFSMVHAGIDAHMAEMGNMDDNLNLML
jgi:hypothetical protein